MSEYTPGTFEDTWKLYPFADGCHTPCEFYWERGRDSRDAESAQYATTVEILTEDLTAAREHVKALRDALQKITDGMMVATGRLRIGYGNLHPGIPMFCDSFGYLAREARAALALTEAPPTKDSAGASALPDGTGEERQVAEYRKCDGRGVICPTLSKRLQEGHKKGLNYQLVMNFKTGEHCTPILLYRESASNEGLVLNFCPWCGSKLNLEYQTPKIYAAGKPVSPSEAPQEKP